METEATQGSGRWRKPGREIGRGLGGDAGSCSQPRGLRVRARGGATCLRAVGPPRRWPDRRVRDAREAMPEAQRTALASAPSRWWPSPGGRRDCVRPRPDHASRKHGTGWARTSHRGHHHRVHDHPRQADPNGRNAGVTARAAPASQTRAARSKPTVRGWVCTPRSPTNVSL